MARKSGSPTTGRYQVVKISEEKHDAYDITASKIGTIANSPEGWMPHDGTQIDQEKDAVRQIYEAAGRPLPQPTSTSTVRTQKLKVGSIKPGAKAKVFGIDSFSLDARLKVMRGARHVRLVNDDGRVRVEGTRDKKVHDKTG